MDAFGLERHHLDPTVEATAAKLVEAAEAYLTPVASALRPANADRDPVQSTRMMALSLAMQAVAQKFIDGSPEHMPAVSDLLEVYAQVIGGYMANMNPGAAMLVLPILGDLVPGFYARAQASKAALAERKH